MKMKEQGKKKEAIEKFYNLKLRDIKEVSPFPYEKYVLIKTNMDSFKTRTKKEEDFLKSYNEICNLLGRNLENSSNKRRVYKRATINTRKDKIHYRNKSTNTIYNREQLVELGLNPISLNNSINKQKTYKGIVWEKIIWKDQQWNTYKDNGRCHRIKCLETSEVKSYKEWAEILNVKANTITKNIKKNYKTKGLTFVREFQ